ncbi:MAG: MFS transporter [Desulfovibrionaceae bacterium]|nr:MFS transporter [Desulfovibrionaceae bacterium]
MNRRAYVFVVLLGLVSLFGDMTYEAARSVHGPFLALLGAGSAVVGAVAGLGELVGYGLRIVSGLISDRTRRYWTMTIVGYAVNLLAVPALALAGSWELAAALIMTERLGKAIRTPARDAMLSHAAYSVGRGWAFALHEAMDQVGAMLGPLIVMAVLAANGGYDSAFAALAAPAVLALSVLVLARLTCPRPMDLEAEPDAVSRAQTGFRPGFWLYLAAACLVAAAYADFPLIAFHFKVSGMFEDRWIPLLYAWAMGVDALAALILGRLFDKKGLVALMLGIAPAALFAPLAFSTRPVLAAAGLGLWGLGMGAQESILRAGLARLVPVARRATGYGLFNAGFGLAWFAGSVAMGLLYEYSMTGLIVFCLAGQVLSLPLLYALRDVFRPGYEPVP